MLTHGDPTSSRRLGRKSGAPAHPASFFLVFPWQSEPLSPGDLPSLCPVGAEEEGGLVGLRADHRVS